MIAAACRPRGGSVREQGRVSLGRASSTTATLLHETPASRRQHVSTTTDCIGVRIHPCDSLRWSAVALEVDSA